MPLTTIRTELPNRNTGTAARTAHETCSYHSRRIHPDDCGRTRPRSVRTCRRRRRSALGITGAARSCGYLRRSPRTASINEVHSLRSNRSTGPAAFPESRMRTASPVTATSTQLADSQRRLLRHSSLSRRPSTLNRSLLVSSVKTGSKFSCAHGRIVRRKPQRDPANQWDCAFIGVRRPTSAARRLRSSWLTPRPNERAPRAARTLPGAFPRRPACGLSPRG